MGHEERIARRLAKDLRARCADAEIAVDGGGLHWKVRARHGGRSCVVNCFWYEAAIHALLLGMNQSNARASMRPTVKPHRGAEYLVALFDQGRPVADGRARDQKAAVASICAWLAGEALAEIEQRWPYVDETARRYRALLAVIEPRCRDIARCVLETSPATELWIYSDRRSARVHTTADGAGATFWLGLAQVALVDHADDVAGIVERWLRGATLLDLTRAGATAELHAELLEGGDAARWHWEHTRERIEDDGDVLVGLRPLLRRLAQSDIATTFYSYSSLDRFCFSASSHYPWVDAGLPIIHPPRGGSGYVIEIGESQTECTVDAAVDLVERTLRAYPVRPFFGSATASEVEAINGELERQGCSLRAALSQHLQWERVELRAGNRRCTASSMWTICFEEVGHDRRHETFDSVPAAVAAMIEWLRSP